eukprot:3435686-Prymnesium_polylepis.1
MSKTALWDGCSRINRALSWTRWRSSSPLKSSSCWTTRGSRLKSWIFVSSARSLSLIDGRRCCASHSESPVASSASVRSMMVNNRSKSCRSQPSREACACSDA